METTNLVAHVLAKLRSRFDLLDVVGTADISQPHNSLSYIAPLNCSSRHVTVSTPIFPVPAHIVIPRADPEVHTIHQHSLSEARKLQGQFNTMPSAEHKAKHHHLYCPSSTNASTIIDATTTGRTDLVLDKLQRKILVDDALRQFGYPVEPALEESVPYSLNQPVVRPPSPIPTNHLDPFLSQNQSLIHNKSTENNHFSESSFPAAINITDTKIPTKELISNVAIGLSTADRNRYYTTAAKALASYSKPHGVPSSLYRKYPNVIHHSERNTGCELKDVGTVMHSIVQHGNDLRGDVQRAKDLFPRRMVNYPLPSSTQKITHNSSKVRANSANHAAAKPRVDGPSRKGAGFKPIDQIVSLTFEDGLH